MADIESLPYFLTFYEFIIIRITSFGNTFDAKIWLQGKRGTGVKGVVKEKRQWMLVRVTVGCEDLGRYQG